MARPRSEPRPSSCPFGRWSVAFMRRESRCLIQTEACAPGDECSACGGPGASLRACSYHASPGACQASVLCISLWMLSVNMLVNHCRAVDGRNCGKVDNCRDVKPHRVAGFRLSTCGARYPQVTCAVCASWHGREFPPRFPSLCAVVCYQAWRLYGMRLRRTCGPPFRIFVVAGCRMVLTRSVSVPSRVGVGGGVEGIREGSAMDVAMVDAGQTPCPGTARVSEQPPGARRM